MCRTNEWAEIVNIGLENMFLCKKKKGKQRKEKKKQKIVVIVLVWLYCFKCMRVNTAILNIYFLLYFPPY